MRIKIIDSTLRDGEQKAGMALSTEKKVQIAKLLASLGIDQIEGGTPAMGGQEEESIKAIMSLGLPSMVSSWNRMNQGDLLKAMDCGTDIIHISVPVSSVQIESKLNKSEAWVKDSLKDCVSFVKEKGFIVHVGMEDASRGNLDFIKEICKIAKKSGASMIRYADTVGVASPLSIKENFAEIKKSVNIPLGFHGHNDLGMALSNTLAAAKNGASYVDCTVGGIGERAGNCNLRDFIIQAHRYDIKTRVHKGEIEIQNIEKMILEVIRS